MDLVHTLIGHPSSIVIMVEPDGSELEFSPTRGGPLFTLLRSTGLLRLGKRDALLPAVAFAMFTWAPMALLAAVQSSRSEALDPIMRNPAVHARLLVTIPLLFVSEALLDERCATSYRHVAEGCLRRKSDAAAIKRRAVWLRDNPFAEIAMLLTLHATLSSNDRLAGTRVVYHRKKGR